MRLFLKDNISYICVYFISLFVTIAYIYSISDISNFEFLYIGFISTLFLLIFLFLRYYKNKKVYKTFKVGIQELDKSLKDYGDSLLAQGINKITRDQYMLYNKELEKIEKTYNEHILFINEWVHQMKTPIAVLQLKSEDIKSNSRISIDDELYKLNNGLTLALYYARLGDFKKDFVIKKYNLSEIVTSSVNKQKQYFISSNVFPKVNINNKYLVRTDKKWFGFMIEQIITNAIKYSKGKSNRIEISCDENDDKYILSIKDYGIGILNKDIHRVFDPFFTGENGRKNGESTGMGLYICKKICTNLNHDINIISIPSKGTTVTISISKDSEF